MPAEYRFIVEDIMSGFILTDHLPLDDVRYDDWLNRPGQLTGRLPMSSPFATEELLREGQVAIYVERNGRIDWGGIAWEIVPSSAGQIDFAAEGWLGYWDHREIRTDRQFTQIEQFEIVETLIGDAQDEVVFGDGYDLGITVGWDAPSGVLRDRLEEYRPWKTKNLGDALRQLAAVEDGFDMAMRYTFAGNTLAKDLRLHYPMKGRDTGFVFEYGTGGFRQVRTAKSYLVLDGAAGYASAPWSGDVTTELEVGLRFAPVDSTPASMTSMVHQWGGGGGSRAFRLVLLTSGALRLQLSDGSTTPSVDSSVSAALPTAECRAWATWRASDGRVQFFKEIGGVVEQVGSDRTIALSSIADRTQDIEVGRPRNTAVSLAANVYEAWVRGVDGQVVFHADFDRQAPGTTSFTERSGKTVTITNAEIVEDASTVTVTTVRDTTPAPGLRSNVVAYRYPRIATGMAWVGDGWGDGTDETRLRSSYVDETKRGVYPPLDAAPTFSGVTEPATLAENTAGAFARTNHPRRLPVLTVNPELDPQWGTYELGDTVRALIGDRYVQVDVVARLVGYAMDVTADRPTLTLEEP